MSAFLFRFREPLSAVNAAILLLSLLALFNRITPLAKPSAVSLPVIELNIAMPEVQTLPEPPVVQHTPPAPPAVRREAVKPAAAPAGSEVVRHAGNAGDAVTSPALPALGSTSQLPHSAEEAVAVTPVRQVAAPPAPPANVGLGADVAYVGKVRAYLQGIKRYPTGREASLQRPSGVAVVGFTLRRSGELLDAGIEATSGSMLLDNTALATVRRGTYPTFPEDAWVGKAQQRFSVELDFLPK